MMYRNIYTSFISSADCKICQVEHKKTTKCKGVKCECKKGMQSVQEGDPTAYGCQSISS